MLSFKLIYIFLFFSDSTQSTRTAQKNVKLTKLGPNIQDICSASPVASSSSMISNVISLDEENDQNQDTVSEPPSQIQSYMHLNTPSQ